MKTTSRLLALLLTLAMLFSLGTAALAASPVSQADGGVTGSITAMVRIDYAQSLAELERRNLRLELFGGNASLGQLSLTELGQQSLGVYTANVSARSAEGGELLGGEWPGALEVTVSGLPQGRYELVFTGRGYRRFSQSVTLSDHAQHLTLGTGDATFTLGDVTGDGKVTTADRAAFSSVMGSRQADALERYDLNGDGAINIVDLAYVNRLTSAAGDAVVLSTTLLAPPADWTAAADELAASGTQVTGELASLFTENTGAVELTSTSGEMVLPLPLKQAVDTEAVTITTPHGTDGEILTGIVTVEDDRGNTTSIPFDYTAPEGVHAIGEGNDGAKVITISLGKRVPVKKVTVTVTKTAGGQFAAVEAIQFLQDIVPDVPTAPHSVVSAKSLKAEAGNECVTLRWGELPNVSGYKVLYWPQEKAQEVKELHVDVATAKITGLKNLQTYDFTVTPTDGNWEGAPSAVISATPIPSSVPDKVDMLSLKALDGAIAAAWKKGKSATYYRVYYLSLIHI